MLVSAAGGLGTQQEYPPGRPLWWDVQAAEPCTASTAPLLLGPLREHWAGWGRRLPDVYRAFGPPMIKLPGSGCPLRMSMGHRALHSLCPF